MSTGTVQHRPIQPRPEFAGILKEEEVLAAGPPDDLSTRINGWFERLLLQAGVRGQTNTVLFFCMLGALALGGGFWVLQENPLTTALGVVTGAAVPLLTVVLMRVRRQRELLRQLPPAIDELARAAKTGRSLEQCLRLVAEDTPPPLGDELRYCVRRLDLGLSLSEAVKELPERTGLIALTVFATTLSVHQQTGGDLIRVLERLARTLRDRLMFVGRVRSATIGSRATAVLMLVLPVFVVVFFTVRDPNYLSDLLSTSWGVRITVLAVLLQVVGSFWVWRILVNTTRV